MGDERERSSHQRSERSERDAPARAVATPAATGLLAPGLDVSGVGNRALLALLRSGRLQRKARIAGPEDPRESHADSMADAVSSGGPTPREQHRVESDGGSALNDSARSLMEARFGEDFGSVRVHAGPKAAEAANALQARAFAVGEDIVFGEGQFRPESTEGRRLLAHELAHVVQQRRSTGLLAGVKETERDARRASSQASGSGPVEVRERAERGVPQMDSATEASEGKLLESNAESLERLGPGGAKSAQGRVEHNLPSQLDRYGFGNTNTVHLEISGAAARGSIDSKTDIVLDLRDVIITPERPPPKPDPKDEINLGPRAHLRYLREINLTDAAGRQCRVVIKGYLSLTFESLLEQAKGKSRPLDFETLLHLKGANSEFSIALLEKGNIPVSVSMQDRKPGEVDLSTIASAAATALTIKQSGASASADFARPESTVGEQFDSIEQFLRVGEEMIIAERQKERPKTEHHQGGGSTTVGSGKPKKRDDDDKGGWGSLALNLFITAAFTIFFFVLLPEIIVAATGVSLAAAMTYVGVSLLFASLGNNLIANWKKGRAAGASIARILVATVLDTFEISKVEEAITDQDYLTGQELNRGVGERIAGGIEGAVGSLMNAFGLAEWAGRRVPRFEPPDVPVPEPPGDVPIETTEPPPATGDPWASNGNQIPLVEPDVPALLEDWPADVRAEIKNQGIPDITERRAAVAKAAEDAKAAEAAKQAEIQAAAQNAQPMVAAAGGSRGGGGPIQVGSVRSTGSGGRGGGRSFTVVPPPAPPSEPVFEPGAPRNPTAVTKTLKDAGLSDTQIAGFGEENAKRLGTKSADLVASLGEHFTADDLKSLGQFLADTGAVLDKATAEQLIKIVPRGKMSESIPAIGAAEYRAGQTGLVPEIGEGTGLNVAEPRPRTAGGLVPLWKIAEQRLGPILEERFGPGWQREPRQAAPGAAAGETLGSTVPEYYRENRHPLAPNVPVAQSFEVKRLHLDEMGIGPNGELQSGPSRASRDAIARARRQVEGRRWIHPAGTEQSIVFNVTGQGVKNVQGVGAQLRTLLQENDIHYDRIFVQDGEALTEIQ